MLFESPENSVAFRSLLDALQAEGIDSAPISRLFWLINAHPRLIAHARVFHHVASLLDAPAFSGIDNQFGQWVEDIPAWRRFGLWVGQSADKLAVLEGLDRLFETPKNDRDHPILGEGVGRHALVAALWPRHQSEAAYPPEADEESVAWRYYCLQAQMLLSQLESRSKHSKQSDFEQYDGDPEFARTPCATASACLALREFSLSKYGSVILKIEPSLPANLFLTQLLDLCFSSSMVGDADCDDAERYFLSLQRYARRYLSVRIGIWRGRRRRHRDVTNGSGGHIRRPGFVDLGGVPGVYVLDGEPPPDDDDIAWQPGSQVYVSNTSGGYEHDSESGPEEGLEHVFDLVYPEQVGGARAKARYQNLAIEMSAQQFAWNFSELTPTEISELQEFLAARIEAFYGTPRNRSIARYQTIAALIIKTSLYFGQPIERAADLRIAYPHEPLDPEKITLVLNKEGELYIPLEWRLPAIMPDYRSDFDHAWSDHNRPLASELILPDVTELGGEIARFLCLKQRPNDRAFEIEIPEAKKQVKALLKELNNERITIEKISRKSHSELMAHGRDQCMAWVATANLSRKRETRMHYARYKLPRLAFAYGRAIRNVAQNSLTGPSHLIQNNTDLSIGARYVVNRKTVKELVAELIGATRAKVIPGNPECVTDVHNSFTLYMWVWQSMATTMRAITQPVDLIRSWNENPKAKLLGLADKEGRYQDKARLLELPRQLADQFSLYATHCRAVERALRLKHTLLTDSEGKRDLFLLSPSGKPKLVKPGVVEEFFDDLGFTVLANFARSFLRTELIDRGCEAEVVDAFLGHAGRVESPFGIYSTFDYAIYRQQLAVHLPPILKTVGLKVIKSRLVR